MAWSMRMPKRAIFAPVALIVALLPPGTAVAQDLRDFCPDRPGLGTPACTTDPGHVTVEIGLLDWTLDRQGGSRDDTILAADLLLRYGLTDDLEAQVGWTALGHVRTRSTNAVDDASGTGDVFFAIRRNLRSPDGSGLAVAIMPYATLPTGGGAIGAGDWGAGVLLPVSRELGAGVQIDLTGLAEAAVDDDRRGRHLAYGTVLGFDVLVGEEVGITVELSATREHDPTGASTELIGAVSAGWSPDDALQFDIGANLGLNRPAPDLQLYIGVARRF